MLLFILWIIGTLFRVETARWERVDKQSTGIQKQDPDFPGVAEPYRPVTMRRSAGGNMI